VAPALDRGFVSVGGVRVCCVRGGEGEPVVLLLGMGASAYSPRRLVELLAERFAGEVPEALLDFLADGTARPDVRSPA
jgi:hypothetical protein